MSAEDNLDSVIHIVCAADQNYAAYAGITMTSVLMQNAASRVHLHLLSDGVGEQDLERFNQLTKRFNCAFFSYDLAAMLSAMPHNPKAASHLNRTAYARLFIAEVLPKDVRACIYLDCDIICVADLTPLWQICLSLDLVGAVRDPWMDGDIEMKSCLNMPADAPYYNSGVLCINLSGWHKADVGSRLEAFLSGPIKTKQADQDAINSVLWKEITEIDKRWNCLAALPKSMDMEREHAAACNIHFVGGYKPWHLGYGAMIGTRQDAYLAAKAASPWRYKLPDPQIGRIRRKLRKITRNYLSSAKNS